MKFDKKNRLEKIKVYEPGKPLEELKRQLNLPHIYKLASNEIPFYPRYAQKELIGEIRNLHRYPEASSFYLREKIARRFKVKREQIVFGNGSDEIIVLTLRTFIDKGDEVIVGYPTFLIYEIQAKIAGAQVRRVALKNFRYDLNSMVKAVNKKTKLIFIANPDNPCGTFLSHREVEEFLAKIPPEILVYFDEAYYEFAPRERFPNSLVLLRKRGNLIFSRTFSKAYGLAGLRIGYCISTKEIAQLLNKVREPFNINRMAQVAACLALENKEFLKKILAHTQKEKEYLYQELRKLGLFFVESATNFILVDWGKDTQPLYNYLLKKGVIIREMKAWGLNSFFRLTVGLHKENKKLIKCLKEFKNQGRGI